MPKVTPRQKVDRVKNLGGKWVKVEIVGDSFIDATSAARKMSDSKKMTFVHPFNDPLVIAGQGTVGVEILEQLRECPDYVVVPVGGGGLIAGLGSYVKVKCPAARIVGVEASGAAGMNASLKAGKPVFLEKIDTFVDGTAVNVGDHAFAIAKKVIDKMVVVPEGKVCTEMISLYQRDGIVAEPAGALSVAALDQLTKELSAKGGSASGGKGKTIVCILSGGNNDISRYPEIIERSLVYQGLKHYFIINFSQRPGALRSFLDDALGASDDITLFEYTKKNNRENGPALVGIEMSKKEDLKPLMKRMDKLGMTYELLAHDSPIFRFLI